MRRHSLAVAAAFVVVCGSAVAMSGVAQKPSDRTLYACVTERFHTLNLSTRTAECGPGERKIAFNGKGRRGARGPAGADGKRGADGATGPVGPAGATGPKGETGETGDTGPQGEQGLQGEKGDKGDTGATGAQGEQGLQGDKGDKGDKGDTGDTGATGAQGLQGLAGPAGPTGPKGDKGDKGDQGDPGPAGPAGGGVTLVNGNGATIGRVISADRDDATVITATGYLVSIPFDAQLRPAQIYYTGASCTGTAYLNDGNGGNPPFDTLSGKWVVYSGSLNTLMAPATVSGGISTGVAFTAATLDNPDCGANAGTRSGWQLTPITRAAAGLPATLSTPITIQ